MLMMSSPPPPFQSTLPVWGATLAGATASISPRDFNPRSPCGERLLSSILPVVLEQFQSTLPVWGATAEILNKSPAKRDKEQE